MFFFLITTFKKILSDNSKSFDFLSTNSIQYITFAKNFSEKNKQNMHIGKYVQNT